MKYLGLIFILLLGCSQEKKDNNPATKIAWMFSESLNKAKENSKVFGSDSLEMVSSTETDFFIEPGQPPYNKANAPLLLIPVDNSKPFTFSIKVSPTHLVKYDAGMAFLYVNDSEWLKFAFEVDERMIGRIVTVKTKEFSDDNNHDVIPAKSVYLKISSDTKVVGFYYSLDAKTWQLVRVFKNEYPQNLKIGIGSQSPAGKGNKSIFSEFQFAETNVKDFRMGI
ncbi:hypothetical protein GCM10011514_37070 [Emticicia aquatilis]|uniref:DUF1349 domain-containing protein n=1 Tax=Emticicia aquatilis TaxID=1537369 RepID=A0A916Z041_9BACT|nr:DUF1349 domain-containing protein [Emticicia aquatilis]GGD69546.1 hypothetical protein GCM10011514_37070 [Emticicia aquatilis]